MSILPQLEHCSSKKMNTWLGVWDVGEDALRQGVGWGRDSSFGGRSVFGKRQRAHVHPVRMASCLSLH